ncbi:uncharacterized protein LOC133782947 isoform X1 [Humulus lupulus]|uniref:uncharacterized protein LOC133782947 isoform X1 n=1 Tax=Humulus lupulus TaxID=3486 RepID=UPI002B4020D8|nr:uncharacterized protein LOC133782947 isoform X1 [Humulus lupulus]XP_062078415.1 uncharacterized protein LOC133782947 isoform X1 [Humulus lupulus]XP_062078416.1 uncharacterized protein LOC133782947 isoform X1 [Humulus lupulus]
MVYKNVHTCSLEVRQKSHRQAALWVVGHLIKNKYTVDGTSYMANNIKEDMKKIFGIDTSYENAWRCREKALTYVRGTYEDSYCKLSSYLHMLQQKNPGTITDFVTEDGRFLYCFVSLGFCRRGFRFFRPVICVDDTFLKNKHGGHMLCVVALDANNHLYTIAFRLVGNENHNSWKYFITKLKEAIGDIDDLAFMLDRPASIIHALEVVFPDAYHDACYHHINMNVKARFKTDHSHNEMWAATYVWKKTECLKHFENIKRMDPPITVYLEGIGFDK